MMKLAAAVAALPVLLATSVALAQDPSGAPLAASSPVRADKPAPATAAAYVEREREHRGFTMDLNPASLVVPVGSGGGDLDMSKFGPGYGLSFMIGYYPTRHLGISAGGQLVGFRASAFCEDHGASGGCSGLAYQVPVMAEYAFDTRKQGLYVTAGTALFSTYSMSGSNGRFTLGRDVGELKVGLGYRITAKALRGDTSATPATTSADLFAGADLGQFDRASIDLNGVKYDGAIESPAWHATLSAGARIHWSL